MKFYINGDVADVFKWWLWKVGNALLCRLEGIALYYTEGVPEAVPVYSPFIKVEKHPGQFIVHVMFWSQRGFYFGFQETRPYFFAEKIKETELELDE